MTGMSFSHRAADSRRELQSVAITNVDPVSRTATGVTRIRTVLSINCAYATGETITTPAVGDQWYVERFDNEWRLYGRIPFNDPTLNIEPEEGQVLVGSASGPLELNGTEVRSNGTVFRLNGVYYRDDGETLQRSADKEVWEPISGTAAGAIQLIGNALSGIPVTEDVAGFLERLGDEETETLQALAEWAQGLGDEIGNAWNVACDNPFFTSLRELGSGDRPIDQVVTGFQAFVNDLWGTLFCGFTGNLTPQTALTGLGGISGLLAANPLVQGLADLIGDSAVGNLAVDAISGATEFLQQLVDLLLCNFTGELTPQGILDAIGEVLTPLTESPFIQGLSSLADTLGTGVGNLFQDAIAGATGLVQAVFGAIFCDFSGDFTPQAMIAKLTEVLTSVTENPFVAGLISFAEGLGHTVGGGIEKAFAGANELLEALFGVFFCDNEGVPTPQVILDSVSGVVDYIRTNPLVAGLVEFIEGVGTTSTGFLQKALEGAFEFFNQIVNTIFCNLPGQPKPADIMASLVAVIASVTDNPYVAMLRKVAEFAGDTSTNLIQQLMAGITGIFDWFVDLLNTLIPFFDWNQIKTLDFPAMMSGLLNDLNPLAFLGPDGVLPLNRLPEIAFDALTGATAFLQDNIFGPLQSAILGGLDGTLTGGLAALNSFFDGALGAGGSLLQQIADAMTGQGNFVSGPLATLQSLFSGISLGGGNLISQITQTLDEFVTNLDIATIVSKITGIEVNSLPNPLETLGQFFSGLSSFTGSNTLISQILAQAGSNLKPLVSAITGVAENAISDVVATASQYFGNFRDLFSMDFGAGFNLPAARDALVGILNSATGGILSGALISSLDPDKITDLAQFITGKINATAADIQAMFGNLRSMFFDPSGAFTLLPGGVFSAASAANAFVVNVLSKATSAIGSVKIPALAIADLGINQISNLISTLTGGATLAEFGNFFTNLRKFLGIGSGAGLVNFLVSPGSFSLVGALNSFISNVLNQATTTINDVLLPSLDITKITDLVGFITGKTSGFANTDLSVFFGNLRGMLNIGTGAGQINLMVNQTVESLQDALFSVVSGVNDGINTFLTQSGLSSWLGGNLDLTQIGNFFTNLTEFFKVADFTVSPAAFAANLATTAGHFVNDVINQAATLISPLKVLGVGGSGTLTSDLDAKAAISSVVEAITGSVGASTLSAVQSLFSGLSSMTGTSLVNKFTTAITGGPLTLTNFFSGFNSPTPVVGSLAYTLAQSLGGATATSLTQISNFFTNLRSFLGIGTTGISLTDFLSAPATFATKLTGIIQSFISNVLQRTGLTTTFVTLAAGATQIAENLIPNLPLDRISNLSTTLTGAINASATDVANFFTNIRTFLGGGGFLVSPGSFSLAAAAESFISNVLRGAGVVTKLVTLNAQNLIDTINIPDLDIGKVKNLIGYITGVGGEGLDIQKFFTNLRSLFGSTNFLVSPGSFSLVGAANQFVVNVLSKATGAGVGSSLISPDILSSISLEKIANLAKALTGQTFSGASGDLAAVQKFFSGLAGFNPSTGANSLVQQIVQSVTGKAAGALTDITGFLGIGAVGDGNTFDPFTGANSLIQQIVSRITGSGSTLSHLANLFSNLRTGLGFSGTDLHSAALSASTLQSTIFNVIKAFNIGGGLNALITQDNLKSWLGGTATLAQIGNFFTNLRTFFGGVSGLGIDLLSGSFNLTTAINSFISGVINKASNGLLNVNLLPSLDITKIENLVGFITGKTSGFADADLNVFFGNFRKMINHGTGTGQINFNASQTEASLRSALFNVVAGINDGLGTALNALITNADLAGWLGGSATSQIKTFFDNLKSFLGGINLLSGSFNPVTEINKLFAALNAATGTLNPARILSVLGGSSSLVTDLNARPLLTSLTSWLTTSGTANDIQRMFSNLRSVLGLSAVNLLSGFSLSTAQNALFNVVTGVNSTVQTLARQVDLNLKAGITEIVKAVTGGTASSYSDLNQVSSFFSGLSTMTGSSLLAKITYAITGSTTANLLNFFADIRSFFSQGGITLGSLNPVTMIPNFVNGLLGASGLIPELNNYSLTIPGVPTAGSYRLSYGGVQTSTINFDASAATIKSRLEALSTIGSGKATVTGSLGEGFQINIDNLSGKLSVSSNTMTGIDNPAPLLERRISTSLIPPLSVDWFPDIGTWASQRILSPIIERLTLATGIPLDDITDLTDPLENGLTKLGVWAQRLVSGGFNLDAIIDSVRRAALSVIPVSGIVDESVNLISQGDFISPTSVPLEDGWSWDATENHSSSSGGAAKVAITSAKARQLYSRQSVSVVPGDTLEMSAYVKTTSNFAGTSNPIRIALYPYSKNASGEIVRGNMVELANKGYTTSWSQIKGTYTVPSGVFSVIPLIRVNSAATAGSVWFDGISLVKTGLLRQNLVESLVEVWQGMWDSVFGSGGAGITSIDVPTIIDTIFGKASDGVDNAADADGKAQTIVDGIVQAVTGSSSTNFLPTNVKSQLQSLFTTLFGQATPKSKLADQAIPNITAGMSTDLQGVLNNIVDALTGTTTGQAAQLPETFTALDGQRESLSTLSESVSELQSDADQVAQGGTSYTRKFLDFSNFNNNTGLHYLDGGTGFLTIDNSQTVWSVGGYGEVRSARGVMTSAFTRTESQKVGINFSTAPEAFSKIYGPAYNYILANSNVGGTQYVFAKFSRTSASLGFTTNGTSETIFASGTIYHDFTPGATYYLETTYNSTGTSYRVLRNGVPIGLSVATTTAYPYRASASHRYSGFMVKSGAYSLFRNRPGSMTSFSLNDNAPVEVIGSGLRRYRTNATGSYNIPSRPAGSSQPEYFLLPSDFFNSGTATSDYSYTTSDSTPNKFTVSVSGWYQVNINYGLAINDMVVDMAPALYKNGSVFSKGNSAWGVSAAFVGIRRGPSQCGSSFIVYLGAGEYIQPGYWQTNVYGTSGTIIASDDGDKTYIEMALLNRSTR